jgi:uncharacterized phage protein gp47/JayE
MINLDNYTYEVILDRMLSRISDDLDKREGSIIFDALAPAAYELAESYEVLRAAYENTFVGTASEKALDLRAEELGIERRSAVKSVRKGCFYQDDELFDVPLGSRFSTLDGKDNLNFVVMERLSEGQYKLECEKAGEEGNYYQGELAAINDLPGLTYAELAGVIVYGQETETDEKLKERIWRLLRGGEAQNGNVNQYLTWAEEYEGIGRARVFTGYEEIFDIKVSILNSLNDQADPALIEDFQNFLDPDQRGLGNGQAPIGARVEVGTADYQEIDVEVALKLAYGYTPESAVTVLRPLIEDFFREISYHDDQVNYIETGLVILSSDVVVSVREIMFNGVASTNIPLGSEVIPKLKNFDVVGVD